jgi:hypothetical protein
VAALGFIFFLLFLLILAYTFLLRFFFNSFKVYSSYFFYIILFLVYTEAGILTIFQTWGHIYNFYRLSGRKVTNEVNLLERHDS